MPYFLIQYKDIKISVLGPSLHNTNPEESLCSTAYLELFIRSITSKPLLKCLLQFIVLHEHEGVPIIETLTQRLGKNKVKSPAEDPLDRP